MTSAKLSRDVGLWIHSRLLLLPGSSTHALLVLPADRDRDLVYCDS